MTKFCTFISADVVSLVSKINAKIFATQAIVKVNLHSIRFLYVFVLFFTFLLLREKVCAFHPHFYKSISALSRLLYVDKNFVQKFCVGTIRAIFRNKAVPLYKKFFRKTFVQYVTVWFVRIWTYKNADEKSAYFVKEKQKRKKTDGNVRKTDTV